MKIFKKSGQIRSFILLFLLLSLSTLEAQDVKVMTLLSDKEVTVSKPAPDKVSQKDYDGLFIKGEEKNGSVSYENLSYLQFNLGNMPNHAQIKSLTLRIYLKEAVGSKTQSVKVYPLDAQKVWSDFSWETRPDSGDNIPIGKRKAIGLKDVSPKQRDSGTDFKFNIKDPIINSKMAARGLISLLLAASKEDYEYYAARTAQEDGYAYQPKLIIEYSIDSHLALGNWAQMKQDPQHSGQQTWASNVTPDLVKARKIIEGTNQFSYTKVNPVIYDGQLICAVQQTGTGNGNVEGNYLHRYALTSTGERLNPESPRLSDIVKHQPVVGPKKQLYCILGKAATTLVELDLENNFEEKKRFTTEPVTATPVVGIDGSLYLSTKGGLYAYTPDFKIKWKYAPLTNLKNHHFGSLALSKDEQKAYVVFGDDNKLVVLDTRDGTVLKSSEEIFSIKIEGDETKIPVPAVDVKTGKVVVLDGFRTGKQLTVFNIDGNLVKTYDGCGKSSECFSQPVITNGNAYFIQNGALMKLDLAIMNLVSVGGTSLNPASTLAADKNGNVYVLNTTGKAADLTIYNKGDGTVKTTPLNELNDANLTGNRLLLAPDGNLVIGNDNFVALVQPVSFVGDVTTLSITSVPEDQKVYRTINAIEVGAVVHKSPNNTILYAGKSISFKPGFSVESGAKLTCNIGNRKVKKKSLSIGDSYAGGIIVHLTGDGHGLVAVPEVWTKTNWLAGMGICNTLNYDGYTDWRMPSKEELNLIYENLFKANLGNFVPEEYWSSEVSGGRVMKQNFANGAQEYTDDKDRISHHVRPVRSF